MVAVILSIVANILLNRYNKKKLIAEIKSHVDDSEWLINYIKNNNDGVEPNDCATDEIMNIIPTPPEALTAFSFAADKRTEKRAKIDIEVAQLLVEKSKILHEILNR